MQIVPAADSIFLVKGILSPETCRTVLANYERDPRKQLGHVIRGRGEMQVQEGIKVSTDLIIRPDGDWIPAYDELNRAINEALTRIAEQVPSLQVWPLMWSGYKIQHYRRNEGHFKWHFDAIGPGTWHRQLAMVLYLNTVEEGGQTCFDRQNLTVKPVAGDAVFFPTFWTHSHCGLVPRSDDKFIISTFVSFDIPSQPASDVPATAVAEAV